MAMNFETDQLCNVDAIFESAEKSHRSFVNGRSRKIAINVFLYVLNFLQIKRETKQKELS
jgi:hypothetical protein